MKIIIVAFVILVSGCSGTIRDYELQRLADICGGYDQIKSTWVEFTTTRGTCKTGEFVSVND